MLQHHLLEVLTLQLNCFCIFVKNQLNMYMCVYFWVLSLNNWFFNYVSLCPCVDVGTLRGLDWISLLLGVDSLHLGFYFADKSH